MSRQQPTVDTSLTRRLVEKNISEGNIAELPIWFPSQASARSQAPDGRVDLEAYQIVVDLMRGPTPAKLTIRADPRLGFPTVAALDVLLVVIDQARRLGLLRKREQLEGDDRLPVNTSVPISPYDILRRLGRQTGGEQYRQLARQLSVLVSTKFFFEALWYDKAKGRRVRSLKAEGLIKSFDIELPEDGGQGRLWGWQYVELSSFVWRSLEAGYYFGIDLDYYASQSSELARRLYVFLTKKDRWGTYEEDLEHVFKLLHITGQRSHTRRRTLARALEALMEPSEKDGKSFIAGFEFFKSTARLRSPDRVRVRFVGSEAADGDLVGHVVDLFADPT